MEKNIHKRIVQSTKTQLNIYTFAVFKIFFSEKQLINENFPLLQTYLPIFVSTRKFIEYFYYSKMCS